MNEHEKSIVVVNDYPGRFNEYVELAPAGNLGLESTNMRDPTTMHAVQEWLDNKIRSTNPKVMAEMARAGFRACSAGQGNTHWERDVGDGTKILICSFSQDIDGHAHQPEWTVGRYGDDDTRVEVGPITLSEALAGIEHLPSPTEGEGLWIEAANFADMEIALEGPAPVPR